MPTTVSIGRTLSKSDYKLARSCDAKLYFRENRYPDANQSDEYLRLLRDGAFMVEALAQAKRPDGILCEYGPDAAGDSARTLELLQGENVVLFQATLLYGRRLARFDIIEKSGSTIRLVEVKAKSIDGAKHKADLENGGLGLLRAKRKPFGVLSDWQGHVEDVAFQKLVLNGLLPGLTVESWLLLVDTSKRTSIENVPQLFQITRDSSEGSYRRSSASFIGSAEELAGLDLLVEINIAEEVASVEVDVDREAARFETFIDADWSPALALQTGDCKECEFKLEKGKEPSGFTHCWGSLADSDPHVLDLSNVGSAKYTDGSPLVAALFKAGKSSLLDVPDECLKKKDGTIGPQAEQQLRQIKYTRSSECWIGPELRPKIERITYPLHFIDFEASRLALPYHAKMRPYGQVAFQWSCHTVSSANAAPTHCDWLNTTELWPNGTFVRELRKVIGDSDQVATWSAFEGSTLREIDRELKLFEGSDPEMVAWIDNLVNNRIVDLHKWAQNDFYHPGMKGRTSIKVVMDALWKADPAMRDQFNEWTGLQASESKDPYRSLSALTINGVVQDVREGTGAIRAYEAMMYGVERSDQAAKRDWCTLLKDYCKLDTMSMILVFEHWKRVAS